jgi:hypothetical protein
MSEITGKLLADLFPDGVVRIVFIPIVGGGTETSLTAKDLVAAEIVFMTCGLAPERAAALRMELERNKGVGVETAMDESVAAQFRRAKAAGA